MKLFSKFPISVCGLALALASLGNLIAQYGAFLRYFCGILSFIILLLFTIGALTNLKLFIKEFDNPVALGVLITYSMAIIVLSTYVKPFIGVFAVFIWLVAIVLHFLIMLLFLIKQVFKFKIANVFPTWFIPAVGVVVISGTAPAMNMVLLGQIMFCLGFLLYFIMLFVILYRMIKIKGIPESARPTVVIFAAPVSLCLVGYFSSFTNVSIFLVLFMFVICVISYIYALIAMSRLIMSKFYPTFSAFTFPMVISAAAFKVTLTFLFGNSSVLTTIISLVTLIIAVIVVLVVIYRFCRVWFNMPPSLDTPGRTK